MACKQRTQHVTHHRPHWPTTHTIQPSPYISGGGHDSGVDERALRAGRRLGHQRDGQLDAKACERGRECGGEEQERSSLERAPHRHSSQVATRIALGSQPASQAGRQAATPSPSPVKKAMKERPR